MLDCMAKEKAELLSGFHLKEIDGITPETLAGQIEGYGELMCMCQTHFDMHLA